jgi:hypothetical protein
MWSPEATVKVATVRDFGDRAMEWLRSEDVVLVTRDGQPAGFWVPWDEPGALPDELRNAVFQRLSSMVREQLRAAGVSEEDVLADFVDANVLLSALIGGRASDALAELGPGHVRAADEVGEEVRRWLPELAARRRLDPTVLLAGLQIAPVRWCEVETYDWLEPWARRRMAGRDEDDWPTDSSSSRPLRVIRRSAATSGGSGSKVRCVPVSDCLEVITRCPGSPGGSQWRIVSTTSWSRLSATISQRSCSRSHRSTASICRSCSTISRSGSRSRQARLARSLIRVAA